MRYIFILSFSILALFGVGLCDLADQVRVTVEAIEGLEEDERGELFRTIRDNLPGSVSSLQLSAEQIRGLEGVINTGLFEEIELTSIGRVAGLSCAAMLNGADPYAVSEIAMIGFSDDISEIQLRRGAQALKLMMDADISPDIYQQAVSYSVYNDWEPGDIIGLAEGIVRGKSEGVPLDKLTLALIIRVDQGLGNTTISQAVGEEIAYIKNLSQADPDRRRRDAIFESMRGAEAQGLPTDIAREFYYNAVEEGWTAEESDKLFRGLSDGVRKGLTAEKLTLAFIIRMEMDRGKVPVEQIIREESDYVASLQKRMVELRQEDSKNRPAVPEPPSQFRRSGLNVPLMMQVIDSYLGTPYQWGGTTRNGIDCSGFTQAVYIEHGLLIPRVSREQYNVGQNVDYSGLAFGDLVFFNKSGFGRITHVGLYVGNGQFAQSSCSKGVTISLLGKSYYKRRYVGAKRIVG